MINSFNTNIIKSDQGGIVLNPRNSQANQAQQKQGPSKPQVFEPKKFMAKVNGTI